MSRLTLRLPESLHKSLAAAAHREGVSLNQYLVYALARHNMRTGSIQLVPPEEVAEQRVRFQALLEKLGPPATDDEIADFLARRGRYGTDQADN